MKKDDFEFTSDLSFSYKNFSAFFNNTSSEIWSFLELRCRVFYELYLIEFRRSQQVLKSFVGNYAFDDIYSPIFIGSLDSGFLDFIWRLQYFLNILLRPFIKFAAIILYQIVCGIAQ